MYLMLYKTITRFEIAVTKVRVNIMVNVRGRVTVGLQINSV